jgi:hypothetical protein
MPFILLRALGRGRQTAAVPGGRRRLFVGQESREPMTHEWSPWWAEKIDKYCNNTNQ